MALNTSHTWDRHRGGGSFSDIPLSTRAARINALASAAQFATIGLRLPRTMPRNRPRTMPALNVWP